MMNKLAALLGGQQQPTAANLGTGMAAQAARIIQSRPYQLHVQEMRSLGMEPMSPEEFAAKMQGRQ